MSAFVANVISTSVGVIAGVAIIGGKKDELRFVYREYTVYCLVAAILIITGIVVYSHAEILAILICMVGTGLAGAALTVLGYIEYVKSTTPPVKEVTLTAPTSPQQPAKSSAEDIDIRIDKILKRNREHRP